jgi:hypothetical protein
MANKAATSTAGRHRQILGVCWLAYGILRIVGAICLVTFSGTATLMFGALLTRVPNPFVLMSDFHALYTGAIVLAAVVGVLGILVGLAFFASQRPPRVLALVTAFLAVSEVPFGTTLGIYTLILFLHPRSDVNPAVA